MDIYQRVPQRRLVDSVKPMCTYDKVLNQRVDWVEWADIQIYGARDSIYDACATSSLVRDRAGLITIYSIMKEATAVGLVVALLYFSQRVTAGGTLNLTLKLTARMSLTMESCFCWVLYTAKTLY